MDESAIEKTILDVFKASLKVIQRAKAGEEGEAGPQRHAAGGCDVPRRAGVELQLSGIIERVQEIHIVRLERESIISSRLK